MTYTVAERMSSHHFIGVGPLSPWLERAAGRPQELTDRIGARVSECGLEVVSSHRAAFADDGLTLVWILAESHLVLHVWREEGFATLDLHVCDYQRSNEGSARRLLDELTATCFAHGEGRWKELHVEHPTSGALL